MFRRMLICAVVVATAAWAWAQWPGSDSVSTPARTPTPGHLTMPIWPGTPPTFILQAEDDPVNVENAVVYFMALKNAQVPAELHIYAQGGHGYGLRPRGLPIMGWPKLVEKWLHTIKVLPA